MIGCFCNGRSNLKGSPFDRTADWNDLVSFSPFSDCSVVRPVCVTRAPYVVWCIQWVLRVRIATARQFCPIQPCESRGDHSW